MSWEHAALLRKGEFQVTANNIFCSDNADINTPKSDKSESYKYFPPVGLLADFVGIYVPIIRQEKEHSFTHLSTSSSN